MVGQIFSSNTGLSVVICLFLVWPSERYPHHGVTLTLKALDVDD
jgi:hypothetical protein